MLHAFIIIISFVSCSSIAFKFYGFCLYVHRQLVYNITVMSKCTADVLIFVHDSVKVVVLSILHTPFHCLREGQST